MARRCAPTFNVPKAAIHDVVVELSDACRSDPLPTPDALWAAHRKQLGAQPFPR